MLRLSEHEDVVGVQRPTPLQIQIAFQHALDFVFRPEPASLAACPSSRYLTALGQRLDHALDIIETIRRLLPFAGTQHTVTSQKNAHAGFGPLDQIQRQAQGVIWTLVTIRPIIDDKQVLLL
jgi:hypothetical protein